MAEDGLIVLWNDFPEIAAILPDVVANVTKKAAFDIQALAASLAPVDTGFLKSSIYIVTHDSSSYGITAGTPPKDSYLLDEVEKPGKTEAIVAVGANYGLYVEVGTVHMDAQPYLTPAAEAVRPAYEAALTKLDDFLSALGFGANVL